MAACARLARVTGPAAAPAPHAVIAERAPERPPVGVATLDFDDPARGRRLTTEVWYPASDGSHEEAITWDGIFPGSAARDAALRPGPRLPLVLLSHGSGGGRANLVWLAEALATRGYVVAAVDHPGDRTRDAGPEGAFAVWRRARDVSAVLGRLLGHPTFGPRIDARRVGAAGHSSGGYTVLALAGARLEPRAMLAYCARPTAGPECARLAAIDPAKVPDLARAGADYRDRRIRAVAALAPVFGPGATRASLAAIDVPVLVVGSPADEQAAFAANARAFARRIPHARLVTPPDAGHFAFLPACNAIGHVVARAVCANGASDDDRARVHAATVAAVLRFFDATLAPQALVGARRSR